MDKQIREDLKNIWHPYTQMKDCEFLPPIFIEKAEGIYLYDSKGKQYMDTISSWWCNIHGHCHPHIMRAIKDQTEKLDHVLFAGFTHKEAIKLSSNLLDITGNHIKKVFYSDDGSTAVEAAIKMSFQYWQNTGQKNKTKFVSLDKAYHGDTIGTMSLGGISQYTEIFEPLFYKTYKVPTPYCYRCPMNAEKDNCAFECLKPLKELLAEKHQEIAGLIIEPLLLAAAGMIVYPVEYLDGVGRLAKKFGIHLIVDEVATGFGRTGKMFAHEHSDIVPDFLCISKGLTSGTLPLAVTMTTNEVYDAFYGDYEEGKTFFHGHTYTGNPIACSAANASLEIFKKEKTIDNLHVKINILKENLAKFTTLKYVGDIRQIGLIGAIELVKDKKTKAGFDMDERIGLQIYKKGLEKNIILRPLGNIVYVYLPLVINIDEIKEVLRKLYSIIKEFCEEYKN